MPVAQTSRERLRGGLLGPLGQEVTDMLMEELDQAGLRAHIDERFAEQDRRIDQRLEQMDQRFEQMDQRFEQMNKRFEQMDKRFERTEERLEVLTHAIIQLHETMSESNRPANAIVYTVCGTFALVSLTALATAMVQVFGG